MKYYLIPNKFLNNIWSMSMLLLFILGIQQTKAQIFFTEDFETAFNDVPPIGWSSDVLVITEGDSTAVADTTKKWLFFNPAVRDIPNPITGTFALYDSDVWGSGLFPENAILTSPTINIVGGEAPLTLQFDQHFRAWNESYGAVELWNGTDWVEVYNTGFEDIGFSTDQLENIAVTQSIDLNTFVGTGVEEIAIRFRYSGNWDYWWAIDNVKVFRPVERDLALRDLRFEGLENCLGAEEVIGVGVENVGENHIFLSEDLPVEFTTTIFFPDGETSATENQTLTDGTYLQGFVFNFWTDTAFDFTEPGLYAISFEVNIEGDLNTDDNTAAFVFFVATPLELPYAFDFEEYNGENLSTVAPNFLEASQTPFSQNESDWINSAFLNQSDHPNGNAAKINLFTNQKEDWLLLGAFDATENTIFQCDLALTQSGTAQSAFFDDDDALQIAVFTDCGNEEFDIIQTFDKNNPLSTNQSVEIPLADYAGQNIYIGLLADEGEIGGMQDIDLFVDNIRLFNQAEQDLGFVEVNLLGVSTCADIENNVALNIVNEGLNEIDFSDTPANIVLQILDESSTNNPIEIVQEINEDILAVGDTLQIDFDNVVFPDTFSYEINAEIDWPQDGYIVNNTYQTNTTILPTQSLPSDLLDFEGYTGSNINEEYIGWREDSGQSGGNSAWTVGVFGNDEDLPNQECAQIVFAENPLNEWLITPQFLIQENTVLSFDLSLTDIFNPQAAQLSGNEKLSILISTDCMASHQVLTVFDTDSDIYYKGQIEEILLSDWAGEYATLAFVVESEGEQENSKVLFLDNVLLSNYLDRDISVKEINAPQLLTCFSAEEALVFTIENRGLETIDFAQTPLSINIELIGQNEGIQIFELAEGSLAFGEEMTIDLSENTEFNPFDMSIAGQYTIWVTLELQDDELIDNDDFIQIYSHQNADFTVADGIDFKNYIGDNLSELYPKWKEAQGQEMESNRPSEFTDSDWAADFFANNPQDTNFTSARINYWVNQKQEWIISPLISISDTTQLIYDLALCQFGTFESAQLGSDDLFQIMVSTDCGASFEPFHTYNQESTISNTGQTDTINLSQFAGQIITLAFYATEGEIDDPEDVELFLDNIFIKGLEFPPGNVGMNRLFSDSLVCERERHQIVLKATNYSPFTISDFMITTVVQGLVDTVLLDTIDSPIEAFQDVFLYHFVNTGLTNGTIEVMSYTDLADDPIANNDTLYATVEVLSYPEVELGENVLECESYTPNPQIEGDFTDVFWSTGDSITQIQITEPGEYVFTAINQICESIDTQYVEIRPLPIANFTVDIFDYDILVNNQSQYTSSYIWDFGDNVGTSDQENPLVYTYNTYGDYTISLIGSDPLCGTDTTSQFITILDTATIDTSGTAIAYATYKQVNVYPNPCTDFFIIDNPQILENGNPFDAFLLDAKGVLIEQKHFENQSNSPLKYTLSSNMSKGIYYILLKAEQDLFIDKILIQ